MGILAGVVIIAVLVSPGNGSTAGVSTRATTAALHPQTYVSLTPGSDYPTYLGSASRQSSGSGERIISLANASQLHFLWNASTNGTVAAQPVVYRGVVYVGSWDGYEYALNALTGASLWKTYLGQDNNDPGCKAGAGISSTPTVSGSYLYLLGGDSYFYALRTNDGGVAWKVAVGNTSLGYYGWSSPLVYKGSAYVGIASRCDSPLVTGGLVQISLSHKAKVGFFNTTALGTLGASIWSSPALNTSSGTLFVTTGNPGPNGSVYANSILAIDSATLALKASWRVPASQAVVDGDFGATPTLVTPKGHPALVVATNKNGITYAWYQSNLTLAWQHRVSATQTVISASWGGGRVYVVGSNTTIAGTAYPASVRALSPANGNFVWQHGFSHPTKYGYAAPLWFNGLVIVPDGPELDVLNATNGAPLFVVPFPATIQPSVAVSRGELFVGCANGRIYALALALNVTVHGPMGLGTAPSNDSFAVSVTGGIPPYSYNWSFGDGNFSTLPNPVHQYTAAGNYTVALTVVDQTTAAAVGGLERDLD